MLNHGFLRVAAAVPRLRVADCEFNADQIIGLVVIAGEFGHPEVPAVLAAQRKLSLERDRRRLAIGLVGRIDLVAEAAAVTLIEQHRDILRLASLQQVAQETRESVQRLGRITVAIGDIRRHRMPGPEHVDRGIDQVDH